MGAAGATGCQAGRPAWHLHGTGRGGRSGPFRARLLPLLLLLPRVGCEVSEEVRQRLEEKIKEGRNRKLGKPAPRDLPPQNWGAALAAMGLGNREEGWGARLAPLWKAETMDAVIAAMHQVPMQTSYGLADMILESRLREGDDSVDYSIKIQARDFQSYIYSPAVQEWDNKSPEWRLIVDFLLAARESRGSHLELWMEFDQETGPSAPSVFVGPASWLRDLLMAAPLHELLGVPKPLLQSSDVHDLLDPLLAKVWTPFWSSMPWLNETQLGIRRQLIELVMMCVDQMSIYQLGFWLSRDTGMLRAVMEAELIYDQPQLYGNTTEWWRRSRDQLVSLGWRWQDAERPTLLDDMMPQLLEGISHFYPAVNLVAGGLASKIGFEMYLQQGTIDTAIQWNRELHRTRHRQRSRHRHRRRCRRHRHRHSRYAVDPEKFVGTLVRLGLCTPERGETMIAMGLGREGEESTDILRPVDYGPFKYNVTLLVNHIKVTFDPGRPVEAKLYTVTRWKWLNRKGTWWRKPAEGGEL